MRPLNKENADRIAEQTGVPAFLAMMLEIRGFHTPQAAANFLQGAAGLSNPLLLPDMEKAVSRIRRAVDEYEKIAVYGDYDADGITATSILFSYLLTCGANVMYYIPEREGEGYGMNASAVEKLAEQGVKLIVTVDNGISSHKEVELASQLGMDTVITDHHRPQSVLPPALAVVDAWRADNRCPFRDFSGVGVAFQLMMALEMEDGDPRSLLDNYADLVAIGTIGDVVPLIGENRALVQAGLRLLQEPEREGIRSLLVQAGMEGKRLNATSVAFTLVPRINATGRMGSPTRAVRLLTSEEPEEAASLAADICEDNDRRRQTEAEILEKVREQLTREPERLCDRVLVVDGEGWHHGVIGIVAARLVDRFGKPCIVLSTENGEARGSGRSVEGFDLFRAVDSCRALLTRYGGHPMAAGLSLPVESIAAFRQTINRYAAGLKEMPIPPLTLDCRLNPSALRTELPELLEQLEPFGEGNPAPLFGLYGMLLEEMTPVGGGKHLRLTLRKKDAAVRCMQFGMTAENFPCQPGDTLDLAVSLEAREFRGEKNLSITVRDFRPSGVDFCGLLRQSRLYEKYRRGEALTLDEGKALLPDRNDFAKVYRMIRDRNGWHGSPMYLWLRLGESSLHMGKLLFLLDVMEERGLISKSGLEDSLSIELKPVQGKVDLTASPLFREVKERMKKEGA